jgi:preprotein translocase subunit SecG
MISTFVTIVYVVACLFMVLVILIQQKGGGLGSLGGAASQSVFGSGGGTDILARLTTISASIFMIGAMYLAYLSAHNGSDFLKEKSAETEPQDTPGEINWERIGPNSQNLPTPDQAKAMQEAATARLNGTAPSADDAAGEVGELLSSPVEVQEQPKVEPELLDGPAAGGDAPAPAPTP